MDAEVDGSNDLPQQQNDINFTEQANNVELVSYQKGPSPKNYATLKDVPLGQTIAPLTLVAVPAAASVGGIVATQLSAGKHLVSYSAVFVKGVETKVAAFR